MGHRLISQPLVYFFLFCLFLAFTLPKGYPGCAPTNIQTWAWTFWLPVLFFEVPLFLLAVVKSIQVAREEQTSSRIMFILLRDSIMFFGIVLAVILTNCIIWASQSVSPEWPIHTMLPLFSHSLPPPQVGLFSAFPRYVPSVCGVTQRPSLLPKLVLYSPSKVSWGPVC